MFIIKFNRMIRNKWLWGAFATVVVIAFAGSDLISARHGSAEGRDSAGTLNGEPVSFRDYDFVRQMIQIEQTQMGEAEIPSVSEVEVWQRLAALRTAERLGIRTSDEEIIEMLRRDPSFQDSAGRFDPFMYRAILENALGMTPETYQAIRRRQMTLGKLENAITSSAWGVPTVTQEQGRGMTDRFTIRLVEVSNKFDAVKIDISEEELEEYFKENLVTYRIPEQAKVRYATFNAIRHINAVEVDEDDLRDYYDANINRYQTGTNLTAQSFEDVRELVEKEIRLQEAREMAANEAADFSDWLYSGDEERLAQFDSYALEHKVPVKTTEWFSAKSAPLGIDPTADFVIAAFDLQEEPFRNKFSDAVVGQTSSYVLLLEEHREARDPELSEVRDKVLEDALAVNRQRRFWEHVELVCSTVSKDLEGGRTLEEALEPFEIQPGTNQVVTAIDAFQQLPGGATLATRLARTPEGKISTTASYEGGAVFMQVISREPGEDIQRQVIGNQMAIQFRNKVGEMVLEDWMQFNLASMNPVTSRLGAFDDIDDVTEED